MLASLGWLDDFGGDDLDFLQRAVARIGSHQAHALDYVHACLDPTKDGVFAVEPGSGSKSDEELTSVGIGTGIGHAQNACTGVLERWHNLIFEFLSVDGASSTASAGRISALDHEIGDDSMKDDPIVVASLRQGGKVLAGLGGLIFVQLDGDGTLC